MISINFPWVSKFETANLILSILLSRSCLLFTCSCLEEPILSASDDSMESLQATPPAKANPPTYNESAVVLLSSRKKREVSTTSNKKYLPSLPTLMLLSTQLVWDTMVSIRVSILAQMHSHIYICGPSYTMFLLSSLTYPWRHMYLYLYFVRLNCLLGIPCLSE